MFRLATGSTLSTDCPGEHPSAKMDSAQRVMLDYIEKMIVQLQSQKVEQAERRAWSLGCHALLASSLFQYID